MIVLGLAFFVIGAGAATAVGLVDQLLGVQRPKKCPACLCELGACRGHAGGQPDGDPIDILGLYCPLCRAQGAMVARGT